MESILTPEQEELLKRTRETLNQLRDLLGSTTASSDDRAALADSIRQLDDLFLLVIAGEFNAGKSAFINALLGQDLLQEGVTPTTSQIFLVKYGETAVQAPGHKGMWEQTAPVEILRKIHIVDTPGTNAILREHEILTNEFIPRSDLVLFVTSADRPFSESEKNFLNKIRDWGKKIVLVINKIDILDETEDREKVIGFVTESANKLVGEISGVYAVSAKQAQQSKSGKPQLWESSGFGPLEQFITETLDDNGRFRLKLLNPLGVAQKVVTKQLASIATDLGSLQDDKNLIDDIERQMIYYDEDMQRNFKARLSEIDNIIYAMEKRGNDFFEEFIRIGRIPDLVRTHKVERAFEEEVVADVPKQIEDTVNELIDWMVEQDLRQWTAVADHMGQRKEAYDNRIVGKAGPKEGSLAYERSRLIDSIGKETYRVVETYDKNREATHLAESARTAVAGAGIASVASVATIGAALAGGLTATMFDVTGILAGLTLATVGALILPSRKRKAKNELEAKMEDLRTRLMTSLTEQFEREMRRGAERIEDTIAPFTRFVRAENEKLSSQKDDLIEIEAHITSIQAQLNLQALTETSH